MTDERLKRLREKSMKLPMLPGVYIMHSKSGEIIYVGKAKKLKTRVSQYFGAGNQHTEKVRRMVSNVEDFEYIICDSEFEALILECSLIKQHMPKYNILLKDDKGYHYIKVTKGEWPTISASFDTDDKNAEYIGPYISGFVVNPTVDEVRKIFCLPHCGKSFPDCINKKGRPCLNFHIKNCSAPCCGKISAADYRESVRNAVEFLKGSVSQSVSVLRDEMEKAAENLQFEKAARLRDRISAIEKIRDRQKIYSSVYKRQDIVALAVSDTAACFEVFVFQDGKLSDREEFLIDAVEDLPSARAEFLRRYYTLRDSIPPRVAVDGDIEDKELLEKWLSEKRGTNVVIAVPERGEQEHLVNMCRNNASERLAQSLGRHMGQTAGLDELARILGLSKPPKFIESYDISNTAGEDNVAGMVVFKDGKPHKSDYKKFKIKSFSGQDDFRSMAEVIERRFLEYKNAETDEGFGRLPDLILLDGGKGQLSAVTEVLNRMGINVPVFGMVKDSKHKTRAITSGGNEIAIKANRSAYTLVSTIQEEVHRFAIGYHRQQRSKNAHILKLTEIDGVGESRAKKLLSKFKTISAISKATEQQLIDAGMPKNIAENIITYFSFL
ncbi:MAG: excinuclease ABC subunit UvrC [Clostridia bacterium]|nr:excinuclease ABC subunit UvrC [Clostridia bacterium]